jgi:hypothetical protein
MNDDENDASTKSAARLPRRKRLIPPGAYEVGYGKPPTHSRFTPGRSGNPSGRPAGARNRRPCAYDERLNTILLQEAFREVTVREGDKPITIPVAQAVMRSLTTNAAKGDARAQRLFVKILHRAEAAQVRAHEEAFREAVLYKLQAEKEIARRRRLGLTGLAPVVPHPDDLDIDPRTGTVEVTGPVTPEEKAAWEDLVAAAQWLEDGLVSVRGMLEQETDPAQRRRLKRLLRVTEAKLADLRATMPNWTIRCD